MEQSAAVHGEQEDIKPQIRSDGSATEPRAHTAPNGKPRNQRSRRKAVEAEDDPAKRRCVSTACIACRKRKSKCDGNLPACAACSQVYGTDCIYDPNSDHRRKGVYKNDLDDLKSRDSTLHILVQALLNYEEEDAFKLVRDIRSCDSLDAVAHKVTARDRGLDVDTDDDEVASTSSQHADAKVPTFESQLYGKMGDLRLEEGTVRYIGGTSHLIHFDEANDDGEVDEYPQHENPTLSWTDVTTDSSLVLHLLQMYFTWHYPFFTTLSKTLFYRDFLLGRPPPHTRRKTHYCTPLLVNAILALGCHFTSRSGARENPEDSATAGDHFFKEAKRLIMENDEHERPRLTTVQALALMSVREAGCGREARGWVYSGMSFRMACDMGLNLNTGHLAGTKPLNSSEAEDDVRRVTFWGCYLFDKCWSNYLGRLPQLPTTLATVPKVEVFLDEDSIQWTPYTDSGITQAHSQPARTRAVALQITKLCEISNDLLQYFYNPTEIDKNRSKAAELKMLSDIHTRLEAWRRELPKEMEPREGGLSSVLTMHMFFQLLFIHLFRPFLKYTQATSPLPHNVSPRKWCTQAATMISKLMRLYKRSHGLRQICNIVVYIVHSACTIHLLNLPDRNAKRDIVHGVKHLEEIADGWLCARRTLGILSALSRKWNVELPEDAAAVLVRTDTKFSNYRVPQLPSASPARVVPEAVMSPTHFASQPSWQNSTNHPDPGTYYNSGVSPVSNPSVPSQSAPPLQPTGFPVPHQQPSAAVTLPQNITGHSQPQNHPGMPAPGGRPAAPSPSDMFGGVDQLMRVSQDWVYRDQAQFASGFDNWIDVDLSPATWHGPGPGPGGGAEGDSSAGNFHSATLTSTVGTSAPAMPTAMSTASMMMPNVTTAGAISGAVYHPINVTGGTHSGMNHEHPHMMDWLNGAQPFESNMATYDEEEWYQ